jgi:hypothetical protein
VTHTFSLTPHPSPLGAVKKANLALFSVYAVGLIGEIRKKLKVLEDFYADSDPGNGPR